MTTHYAYSIKALPASPQDDPPPGAAEPEEMQPPARDDARPWAGDAYDDGDETDPAHAYATFSGKDGEEAWLDRAPDGTLTGWVRDATGQVWRYVDDTAWALDVDGAQMQRVDHAAGETAPAGDAEASGDAGDGASVDAAAPEDGLTAPADDEGDDTELEATDSDMAESPDGAEEDDSEAPFPGANKPKKKGGK
ncbi:hypothetical protein AB0O47_31985 [Streptomyces noursei]|uniref:hypothetical protein n=1 Tax=Streptomyces noursei TaxID=1971 RepID=UPI00344B4915